MKASGKQRKPLFSFLRRKKRHGIVKSPKDSRRENIGIDSPTGTVVTDGSHSTSSPGDLTETPAVTPRKSPSLFPTRLVHEYEHFSSERSGDDAVGAGAVVVEDLGVPFNGNGSLQQLQQEPSASPKSPKNIALQEDSLEKAHGESIQSPYEVVTPPYIVPSPKSARQKKREKRQALESKWNQALGQTGERFQSLESISEQIPEDLDLSAQIQQRIEQQSSQPKESRSISWAQGTFESPPRSTALHRLDETESPSQGSPSSTTSGSVSPDRIEAVPMVPELRSSPPKRSVSWAEGTFQSPSRNTEVGYPERGSPSSTITEPLTPEKETPVAPMVPALSQRTSSPKDYMTSSIGDIALQAAELKSLVHDLHGPRRRLYEKSISNPQLMAENPNRQKRKTMKRASSARRSNGSPVDLAWPEELASALKREHHQENESIPSPKKTRSRPIHDRSVSVKNLERRERMRHHRPIGPKSASLAQLSVLQEVDWKPPPRQSPQRQKRSINPLNRKLWLPAQPIAAPSCLKGATSASRIDSTKEKSIHWPFHEIQEAIYPPIYLKHYLDVYKERLWWPRKILRARSKEDSMSLHDSISARAYNRDCTRLYDALEILIRQKRVTKDLSMTLEEVKGLLTPSIIRGLQLGHRGLELGGIARRVAHALEISEEVLRQSESDSDADRVAAFAVDASEVDRLWAYVIALGDQQAERGVPKRRRSAR